MSAAGPKPDRGLLTWSNGLTALRLVSAPFFFLAIGNADWGLAFLLFWAAVATDLVDGRVARARGETSAFGGVLDHASDATFVSLGNLALANSDRVPTVLPFLIAAAFLQYAFDSRILAGRELRASLIGRWNGICYFVPLGVVVVREALGLSFPSDEIVRVLGWVLVVSTLISMMDRLFGVFSVARDNLTRR